MRLLFASLAFLAAISWTISYAQSPGIRTVILDRLPNPSGFTPSCTPSSNFIARTSGQDNAHKTAYDNLICGLNSQSSTISGTLLSRLDGLWMLRAADSTVALLNLVQNSFNLTASGGITFTANSGVAGNGTTGFYDTGFNPSSAGGQFTQNSANIAFCTTSNNIGSGVPIGGEDGATFTEIFDVGAYDAFISNATGAVAGVAGAGLWAASRTTSTLITLYQNATSQATDATATTGITNANIFLLARNGNGSADNFSTITVTMARIGASYSATDESNFRALIQSYMAAIGSGAC